MADIQEKIELLRFLVERGYDMDQIDFDQSEELEEFLEEIEEGSVYD